MEYSFEGFEQWIKKNNYLLNKFDFYENSKGHEFTYTQVWIKYTRDY